MEFLVVCILIFFIGFAVLFFKKASELDATGDVDGFGRTGKDYRKFGYSYIGIGIAVVIVISIISSAFGMPLFGSNGNSSNSASSLKDQYSHDKFDAITIAENVVEGKLKSPSTADFCSISDYTVTLSGSTWTIKGYVDAQNSFGATLRNNFTVKITFTSSTKYTVDSCIIN